MQTGLYANWEYSRKNTTLLGNFPCLISKALPPPPPFPIFSRQHPKNGTYPNSVSKEETHAEN